jgi:inner membrane protein
MKSPLLVRALSIGAIAILILVPILAIKGKIDERRQRADAVLAGFAHETSGAQSVVGPLLYATCEATVVERREDARGTTRSSEVRPCAPGISTPRDLALSASIHVERLHRGIYPINLFRAKLSSHATLQWPAPPRSSEDHARRWLQVYAVYFVSDPRGIKSFVDAAGKNLDAAPPQGFTLAVPLGPYGAHAAGEELSLDNQLELVGTGSLQVAPVAEHNDVRWSSDWASPSFGGAWSPDERVTSATGFDAHWRVSALATRGQADWPRLAAEAKLAQAPGLSVSFLRPLDPYALSYRATEYAFLFVLVTFAALALTETLAAIRLHPVQYALVGSAIAVFFLLLIALSEHFGFLAAYVAAASACVALLVAYLRHPLGTKGRTAAFAALFATLYALLYGVLMSEDNALLLGSLLVFGLLAGAMMATRRLDWGEASARMARRGGPA